MRQWQKSSHILCFSFLYLLARSRGTQKDGDPKLQIHGSRRRIRHGEHAEIENDNSVCI